MRRLFPILFCLLLSVSMTAQDVVLQDSITDACGTEHKFKAKQLIVPGALITAGAVGIAFHDKLGNWDEGHHTSVDDYIQYAPVAANLFLGCLGVKHKHNFVDRVMISATPALSSAPRTESPEVTISSWPFRSGRKLKPVISTPFFRRITPPS